MKVKEESAVSPVIGILLMLVVTLIIAAVVSGFAGGFVKDEKKTPQASFNVQANVNSVQGTSNYPLPTYTYPSGYIEDKNYIEFEHKGGDTLMLNDLQVQFQYEDNTITLGTDTVANRSTDVSCRSNPSTAKYFNQVGKSDGVIGAGDKFRIITDGNYISPVDSTSKYIFFRPDQNQGKMGGAAININKQETYKIIDRKTGKIISSGTFIPTF